MFSSSFVPQMFCHPVTRVFPCFFCFCCFLDNSPPKKKIKQQNKKHIHTLTPPLVAQKKSHTTYIYITFQSNTFPLAALSKSHVTMPGGGQSQKDLYANDLGHQSSSKLQHLGDGWDWMVGTYDMTWYGCFQKRDTPKSSILIRFSIINHPFWGTTIFGNIHMCEVL